MAEERLPFEKREDMFVPIIAWGFADAGLDPILGVAMARHESDFDAGAIKTTGRDGKRGGAFGLFQMTLITARGLGFEGEPNVLLAPLINIELARKLMQQNAHILKTQDKALLCAAHNCGTARIIHNGGKVPEDELDGYVKRVMGWYTHYRERVTRIIESGKPSV